MSLVDLDVGVARLKGNRESQMDRFNVSNHYFQEKGYSLFIIFDGHGDERFSKHASENLANLIVNDNEFKAGNYERSLISAFEFEDYKLTQTLGKEISGGTTATASLFFRNKNVCYVANVGDSTAVLGSIPGGKFEPKAIPVSRDDKMSDLEEFDRLSGANAIVRKGRLIRPGHSVNMTRALGDFDFKAPKVPSGEDWISPIPHINKIELNPREDEFMILASDGLWNVFDEQTIVNEVTLCLDRGYDVHQIASALAEASVKRGNPISDNVTIILIYFVWE
ncbi:10645_t:CDS:2 [Diversispora eburnea]|uniref:protein-serine/threonine phosphatase n=1 Tax=Diversispora eburnea TaxID=1213867 RepID=A0A9N9AD22_9GLOM|nr:10645_t:CDS:2 [Diversispora eburnea]